MAIVTVSGSADVVAEVGALEQEKTRSSCPKSGLKQVAARQKQEAKAKPKPKAKVAATA